MTHATSGMFMPIPKLVAASISRFLSLSWEIRCTQGPGRPAWKMRLFPKPVRAMKGKSLEPKISRRRFRTYSCGGARTSELLWNKVCCKQILKTSSCMFTVLWLRAQSITSGSRVSSKSEMWLIKPFSLAWTGWRGSASAAWFRLLLVLLSVLLPRLFFLVLYVAIAAVCFLTCLIICRSLLKREHVLVMRCLSGLGFCGSTKRKV